MKTAAEASGGMEEPIRVKAFVSTIAYSYDVEKAQILHFTQKSIKDPLRAFSKDKLWGDLRNYDVQINRTGEKLDTTYNVMPCPKAALDDEVIAKVNMALENWNLSALFDGDDPFAEAPAVAAQPVAKAPF